MFHLHEVRDYKSPIMCSSFNGSLTLYKLTQAPSSLPDYSTNELGKSLSLTELWLPHILKGMVQWFLSSFPSVTCNKSISLTMALKLPFIEHLPLLVLRVLLHQITTVNICWVPSTLLRALILSTALWGCYNYYLYFAEENIKVGRLSWTLWCIPQTPFKNERLIFSCWKCYQKIAF